MQRRIAALCIICLLLGSFLGMPAQASGFDSEAVSFAEEQTIRVTLSVSGHAGQSVLAPTEETSFAEGATVLEVMDKIFRQSGISYTLKGNYVSEIAGLSEFDYGKYSGWMYTVGGVYPTVPMGEYHLHGGENIVIRYVESFVLPEKEDISAALVSGIAAKAYTGKALTQSIKLTLGERVLKEKTDYTVSYENNVKVGTAKVHIKGIGQYKGSITKSFSIVLGKAKPTVAAVSASAVKLTWSKVPGAQYYRVYEYKSNGSKKYTALAVVKTNSVLLKSFAAGSTHPFLVKACFKNKAGKEICSAFTAADCVNAVLLCKAPAPKAAVAGKTVTLKWSQCAGAQFYRVYSYNTKTGKYTTLVSKTAAVSVKLSSQAKGNHYYLVRAFNAAGTGSAYSTSILLKVKVK